jgi:hypothetical protein
MCTCMLHQREAEDFVSKLNERDNKYFHKLQTSVDEIDNMYIYYIYASSLLIISL